MYLSNRRRYKKKTHRKQFHGISGWLKLTYGHQTAGWIRREEQPPRIYRGVDKKEWKYWMGDLLPLLERPVWGGG